jgi:hypothetical protein
MKLFNAWLASAFMVVHAASAQSLAEPSDAHPRIFSEPETQAALAELAKQKGSFVQRTVELCRDIEAHPQGHARDGYMGLDWAQYTQACLVAYRATGQRSFGETALVYFRALIDDLTTVGDAAGGDVSARRDSGFAMRAVGPNAALAYDWLHDFPGVDEALRARARSRFRAWTDWYLENGYRARSPGTNYHAGYLFGATLIAIAQGGEAGPDGTRLWRHVIDTIFAHDTLPAMRGDGVLVGGDWGEGWQYGPLSVTEYSLAGRALSPYGLDTSAIGPWLESLVRRHAYALVPGGAARTFAVGDTQSEEAHIPVRAETLVAAVAGPASATTKQWAEAEMRRLHLYEGSMDFPLFRSLAEAARVTPSAIPRADWPRHYLATGSGTLYARFDWSEDAVWFAAMCSRTRDIDHSHPNAGNFVLSRGGDHVIVDPSPYGTLSSLTSNAPTVESEVLPPTYLPSQAYWSERTGFRFIRQLGDGMLAARCDYADQYRIQQTPSDVKFAQRDFVLIPSGGGRDAALLVVDRAQTPGPTRALHLRFRTLAELATEEGGYGGSIGHTRVGIRTLFATPGKPELRQLPMGSCFSEGYTRGNCDAARLPVSEYRTRLEGPAPQAISVVTATGSAPPKLTMNESDGVRLVTLELAGRSVAVAVGEPTAGKLTVPARAATVVLLDVEARGSVTAAPAAGGCALAISPARNDAASAGPLLAQLGADCSLSAIE